MRSGFPAIKLVAWLLGIFGVLLVWDLSLWISADKETPWHYLFNLGYGLLYAYAAWVCFYSLKFIDRTNAGLIARAVKFWGFALVVYAIGQFIWTYYNLFAKVDIPYPSLADLFFLAFYLPMGMGVLLIRRYRSLTSIRGKLMSAINLDIIAVVTLLVLFVLNRPDLSAELAIGEKILNVAYPIGDAFLLSVVSVNWRSLVADSNKPYNFLILGLAVVAAGDIIFSYQNAQGSYWNGGLPDLLFVLFPVIFTYGVVKIIQSKPKTT